MRINYFLKTVVAAATILAASPVHADEGMWMIQDINEALEKKMKERGLLLDAREIYDADAPGTSVADAIVSLGFYCSGSLISDRGLLITNHHCAYSNIAKISTPGHNYLEEGFWAMTEDQERQIPGEQVYFLKKVIDVTGEVAALTEDLKRKGENAGSRRVNALMEERYKKETGMECIMSSMWAGEKYYMAVYKVYTDLRLVAAPPVCIGYFGGDEDNWEWPRHNCDFAMYRIYEDGKPVTSERSLKVSLDGYWPGAFTMVIGYPGRTDRYASSAEIDYQQKVNLPISNDIRGKQMEIIRRWMDKDPEIRLKYSDWFFSLSNVQENNSGMEACYKRFHVKAEKERQEAEMQEWIDSDPDLKRMWGSLIPDLKKAYSQTARGERDKAYFRESLFRGTFISRYFLRAGNARDLEAAKAALRQGLKDTDPAVERELLAYSAMEFFTNLDNYYFGNFQKKLLARFGTDFEAMAGYLWENSLIASEDRIDAVTDLEQVQEDPLRKFFTDSPVSLYNERNGHLAARTKANNLEREYKKALYWMKLQKGRLQYPDANSTMRITYGTVGGYWPNDGVWCNWYSTPRGILQKYNPDVHDFNLDDRQKALLEKGDWGKWGFPVGGQSKGMIVDFLTDNDITGGNSGSPVLNAKGELIGLAFDGNLESLASDTSYTPGYNMCINTDIRFVMWVLDKYAGMKRLLKEIKFVKS